MGDTIGTDRQRRPWRGWELPESRSVRAWRRVKPRRRAPISGSMMAIGELEALVVAADGEAGSLRAELAWLQGSVEDARSALAAFECDPGADLRAQVGDLRILLDEARATEAELCSELDLAEADAAALRRDLAHARATAEIRGRLLDDVVTARWPQRGRAVRRAARVQALLARS
jgi:hypothetical protein